jgi:diketogulonate reductase-like aldo/keto reductase
MSPIIEMDIPNFGIGTYKLEGEACREIIYNGLKKYRLIDNAELYKNQDDIKFGMKRAFDEGIVRREDIWITSKIHNKDQRHLNIAPAIDKILHDLDVEYVDLIILHSVQKNYVEAYEELLRCKSHFSDKMHIGVSNFRIDELDAIVEKTNVKPYLNQVEISPFYQRVALRSYLNRHDIKIQAYCSMVLGKRFDHPNLQDEQYSPDELLLGWAKHYNFRPIPTMLTMDQMNKNYRTLMNVTLEQDKINRMDAIDEQVVNYKQHMDKI